MTSHDDPVCRTVDGAAAASAAVAAALLSLVAYLFFVPTAVGNGDYGLVLRFIASILLGTEVLEPSTPLTAGIVAGAIAVHALVAAVMTATIAFALHRWGLVVGVIGGALLGLAFYGVNYFALTGLFEQFHAMAHWSVALVHILFGAVAGGVYEFLECDPPVAKGVTDGL